MYMNTYTTYLFVKHEHCSIYAPMMVVKYNELRGVDRGNHFYEKNTTAINQIFTHVVKK